MYHERYEQEPSMEEILASIRRIISEDGDISYNIKSIVDFRQWMERDQTKELDSDIIGYHRSASVLKFFEEKNEELLTDIVAENEKLNMGNTTIPGTDIKLINYSICPKCKTVNNMLDLANYYANPKPDPMFKDINEQCRKDTRVCCKDCQEFFLPSLVIVDGSPISEYQWLCSTQTLDATQDHYWSSKHQKVLFANNSNRLQVEGYWGIKIDVTLNELQNRPALVTNLLQYSPPEHIMRFVNNIPFTNHDVIFNRWYRRPSTIDI